MKSVSVFKAILRQELIRSRYNYFGTDNFDEHRFGRLFPNASSAIFNELKQSIKRIIRYDGTRKKWKSFDEFLESSLKVLEKYYPSLDAIYANVNQDSKAIIVKLMAYRILGFTKVKLPTNNNAYRRAMKIARKLKDANDTYDPHFIHLELNKFDLTEIGHDVRLYFAESGIAIDFIIEQYAYKSGNRDVVSAEQGDIVLDLGGCWGDTALYFASKVGKQGRVYSFEFVPENIKLFKINKSLNPDFEDRIEVIPNPVSNRSGNAIYFRDAGPSSKIENEPFEGQTGSATTVTIDEFVTSNRISRVDFIKMDIEGSEPIALQGAIETIRKYKPKLAIAIYHSMEDFVNIPQWIMDLDLGYEIYLGHYTIHSEETVCFAKVKV